MKSLEKNSYAIDKRTGKCYCLKTDTVQTRNRRQCQDLRIYKSKTYRIPESQLIPVTDFEANLCFNAEKIKRGMMRHSFEDTFMLGLHRDLLDRILRG